ncbi:MAG: DNA helicase RecQ [Gammaproteobacteria bacterium]|nr:DNA helicase RecQ [Gammaproteobacteria bacterium]
MPDQNRVTADSLLHNIFGFTAFRGQQKVAIDAALACQDTLVLMPTGGGKSLCYQIPALLREGTGIVISPLIALMQDQVSALHELGINAAYLNSTLSHGAQQQVIEQLQNNEIDLLYIAPERLIQPGTRAILCSVPVSIIAIDEAHCVSQWGHDFRQDYLALHELVDWFPDVPRMALTATATAITRSEIIERLALNEPEQIISTFDRANIRYTVQAKTDARRQLMQFLAQHEKSAGIVYCLARKKVESIAEWLQQQGRNALPYHAGLPAKTRSENQRRFLAEDNVIIVATIAFGMGIDKPDVRFVAHLDLPKSIEGYYQETGRAGRDGEPADAFMVYGLQDVVQLRQMVDSSTAGEAFIRYERQKLEALLGWCEITGCRRKPLLAYFGDELEDNCNNCDNCLTPPTTWDATEAARKLLSTVYRTGQYFGAMHVIDVLLGHETDKVIQRNHNKLSVFGIGTELEAQPWRSVIRQLVVGGYLKVNQQRYGALTLTEKSRPLLRGDVSVHLREDKKTPATRKKPRNANRAVADADRDLWEALRACRLQLATEHNVPPYVIFHDATLLQMIEYRPDNSEALLTINGVGEAKLERYGQQFIAVIREFA